MDVDLQPLPALTYTTIGGIIDLYIFTGPTVQNVIEQYWNIIGVGTNQKFISISFFFRSETNHAAILVIRLSSLPLWI
jgi:lysosomal alpha-glucosidase